MPTTSSSSILAIEAAITCNRIIVLGNFSGTKKKRTIIRNGINTNQVKVVRLINGNGVTRNMMKQLYILLYIALGGAFGACSRYLLSQWCVTILGKNFPYGTLLVNVLGSLIMGLLMAALEQELIPLLPWQMIIGVGFLGALTTFSTFSMDTLLLLQQADFARAGLNVILNVVLSLSAVWLGFKLIS